MLSPTLKLEGTIMQLQTINEMLRNSVNLYGDRNAFKVKEIAQTGVDLISVGALTHSVKSLDLNMEII